MKPKEEAQSEAETRLRQDLEASIYLEDKGDQLEGFKWDVT